MAVGQSTLDRVPVLAGCHAHVTGVPRRPPARRGAVRIGPFEDLVDRLGSAKINMIAVTGLAAGQGRYGAILWVKPGDVKKAAKVFGIGLS